MRQAAWLAASLGLMLVVSDVANGDEVNTTGQRQGRDRPLILVHVMTWFESKPTSGAWGWHWTMGRFDPEKLDAKGRRSVASHLCPLIGPYDSADPDVREYHGLLMKVAGIDGVIVDWYGLADFNDYAMIHRRTSSLFDSCRKLGLKFTVCYEDRALKALVERGKWRPERAVEQGRADLRFCAENWFNDPVYVTWQGRPLFLVFGPDYLSALQWESVLSGLRPAPVLLTLHERRSPAIGSFAWPPMWAAKDGVLDAKGVDDYLDRFARQDGLRIACAFPGFHDFYVEAGVGSSYGYLDARDGKTFRHTLDRAMSSGCPFVQIATWNDFGEGTCIEPSQEHGYRNLQTVQDARRRRAADHFPYRPADFELPLRIYELRKRSGLTAPARTALDGIAAELLAGETARVSRRLDDLERASVPGPTP